MAKTSIVGDVPYVPYYTAPRRHIPVLEGKKTYIVAVLMLAKAFVGYLLGDNIAIDWNLVLSGLGLAALRNGIGKV
jgi:hypothetical protein